MPPRTQAELSELSPAGPASAWHDSIIMTIRVAVRRARPAVAARRRAAWMKLAASGPDVAVYSVSDAGSRAVASRSRHRAWIKLTGSGSDVAVYSVSDAGSRAVASRSRHRAWIKLTGSVSDVAVRLRSTNLNLK